MVIVRREQIEVLSEYMHARFITRMLAHLKATFAVYTQGTSEPDLRRLILSTIDTAARYDITNEDDVQRYLERAVCYGADFDTNPKTSWAGQILQEKDLTGTEKMDRIDHYELFLLRTV